jgi:hypothetical protein
VRYTDPTGHLPGYESELHDVPDNGSNGGGGESPVETDSFINWFGNKKGNRFIFIVGL